MKKAQARIKHEYNDAFDRLLLDAEHKKLNTKLSGFMTRPAYAGTSLEQKDMYTENKCMRCPYWKKSEFFEGCMIKDITLCPRRNE